MFPFVIHLLISFSCAASFATSVHHVCDIAILGGSTSSLGAAITAAEANANLTICFTEITDWPGGQLTASGVSAIDFGPWNHFSPNLPRSFADLVNFTSRAHAGCWVSYDCYLPQTLVEEWIFPALAKLPNLRVFLRTVVVDTTTRVRNLTTSNTTEERDEIMFVTLVHRQPWDPALEWSLPLSETLHDWYSPENSSLFTKTVSTMSAKVYIDATEFGDVVVTSKVAPFTQGAEYPHELSTKSDASCGLAATLVFFMNYTESVFNSSQVPSGSGAGLRFPSFAEWSSEEQWNVSWTYRRGKCNGSQGMYSVNVGDVTQQNWINDVDNAYFFEPEVFNGTWWSSLNGDEEGRPPWRGGVNLTSMKMLEERAYGTYHFLVNTSSRNIRHHLAISYASTGTLTGLSKMPYLRDSRRTVGLDGFRFTYASEDFYNESFPYIGEQFYDVVALGDYLYADMHKLTTCELPEYQWKNESKPYNIPFRALTVMNVSNLLVAGKLMSQTFHANAPTRLHPSEYSSGVAAGAAAVVMVEEGWKSTRDVLISDGGVQKLQQRLRDLGQPLAWTPPHDLPPLQIGFACVMEFDNRCVGVVSNNHSLRNTTIYPTSSCGNTCAPLGENEWLVHGSDWTRSSVDPSRLVCTYPTEVTKSVAGALTLPPDEKMSVSGGTVCGLVTNVTVEYEKHLLCVFYF